MKRILCLLVCLVMMLGLLPAAAGAANDGISEVSISGLEHPIMGQELDFSYNLPKKRGLAYEKDDDFDEVIWYEVGSGSSRTALKNGAKAEEGVTYIAELHLIVVDEDTDYFRDRVNVELSDDMECRVMKVTADPQDTTLIIQLQYQGDYYYDRKHPVELTVADSLFGNGTVRVGDYLWNESDFKLPKKGHFDLTVTWYEGKQDVDRAKIKNPEDYEFEAGQTYTLKVELDSSHSSRHAFFDPDTDILINGEKGDTWVGNESGYTCYALFRFNAGTSVEKVTIKGIEEPMVGETRQRDGFTCKTEGIKDVEFNKWEYETESGSIREFKGTFEAGFTYLLSLDLIPEDGYSLDLKAKDISVNKGKVDRVEYDERDDVYTVVIRFEMEEAVLKSIAVTSKPRTTEYDVGDRFSTKGMVVTATYGDGHTEKITDYEYSPTGTLEKEDTVITITYSEGKITKETELNITVVDDDLDLTGIVITTKPDKTSYKTGETFDPEGMVVTAVYDDKSSWEVTNLEFDPDGELTLEDDTVIVSYTEGRRTYSAKVSIRVTQAEKILSELELTKEPTKTTYYEGETFDPAGMVITAIYEDKSTAVLKDTDYTISPRGALNKYDEVVVITYREKGVYKTVPVEIEVKEVTRLLSHIRITTPPSKLVYTEGEVFDPKGMVVTAYYDDKTSEEVTGYKISPEGKLGKDVTAMEISYTEGRITVLATQVVAVKPILVNPFTDVKEGDYFYDAVLWAYYHEPQVTNGMTDTEFSPGTTCTRGQVVTFLWRAAGCPAPKSQDNPFTDVALDSWYHNAVLWAVEQNITNGTSDTTFSPSDTCTLAHVITFLYRAAGQPGKSEAPETWYSDAMNWAYSKGLFKNLAFSEIQPEMECARRDIVNFLYIQLG